MASIPFKIIMEMDHPPARMQMYLSRGRETGNLFGVALLLMNLILLLYNLYTSSN